MKLLGIGPFCFRVATVKRPRHFYVKNFMQQEFAKAGHAFMPDKVKVASLVPPDKRRAFITAQIEICRTGGAYKVRFVVMMPHLGHSTPPRRKRARTFLAQAHPSPGITKTYSVFARNCPTLDEAKKKAQELVELKRKEGWRPPDGFLYRRPNLHSEPARNSGWVWQRARKLGLRVYTSP